MCRLISELIKCDNFLFCVYRKNSKSSKDFLNNNKVKYIVSDYLILKDLFIKNKFDCIINTACTYMKGTRIDDVVESNLIFPLRLLSLAVESYYGINSDYNNYYRVKTINEDNVLQEKKILWKKNS